MRVGTFGTGTLECLTTHCFGRPRQGSPSSSSAAAAAVSCWRIQKCRRMRRLVGDTTFSVGCVRMLRRNSSTVVVVVVVAIGVRRGSSSFGSTIYSIQWRFSSRRLLRRSRSHHTNILFLLMVIISCRRCSLRLLGSRVLQGSAPTRWRHTKEGHCGSIFKTRPGRSPVRLVHGGKLLDVVVVSSILFPWQVDGPTR